MEHLRCIVLNRVCHKYFRCCQLEEKWPKNCIKGHRTPVFPVIPLIWRDNPPKKGKFSNTRALGGGFSNMSFSPLPGEMTRFDYYMFQMGLKSSTRFSQIIGPQHHPKNDLFIGWRKEWWFANGVHHRAWMLVFGAGWWSSVPRGLKTARTCPVPLAILPTRRTKPARHDRGDELRSYLGGLKIYPPNSPSQWPPWKKLLEIYISRWSPQIVV